MSDRTEKETATPCIWEVVPVARFLCPTASVGHAMKSKLSFFQRLFHQDEACATPFKKEEDLHALTWEQRDLVAPEPDWQAAAQALNQASDAWNPSAHPVICYIAPPHSGRLPILRTWAANRAWRVATPPTPDQILTGGATWLSRQRDEDGPWVLPHLERLFLRHARGLDLVRRFLDQAASGALGCGLLGCDSWAWAYLQHVWNGPPFPALTLQALDQQRLAAWFWKLTRSAPWTYRFRQANNGRELWLEHDPEQASSAFLRDLAASSRGNPGVARAGWRASLRAEPDVILTRSPDDDHTQQPTVWVAPWHTIKTPSLPVQADIKVAFVLHALLLHNGLPLEWLARTLPFEQTQINQILLRLQEAEVITRGRKTDTFNGQAVWQTTALGYPYTRELVQAHHNLMDRF